MRAVPLRLGAAVALVTVAVLAVAGAEPTTVDRDVVVYGATSAGIVTAIQARAAGLSVVIVEPGRHLGGLSAGGLGATDIGNKRAIGGLAREFYRRVGRHYADPAAWTRERPEDFQSRRRTAGEAEMWTFEPHVAARVFRDWLAEAGVEVVRQQPLDLDDAVAKEGAAIRSLRTESGRVFVGRMFVDATYEGDLMAEAGVSFHVGREANATYGETLNGIQLARAVKHQFTHEVDPFVVP